MRQEFLCLRNTFTVTYVVVLQEKFTGVDIRVRVHGGGHVSQIYAIRQAISKALVMYYQKCKYKKLYPSIVGKFCTRDVTT